MDVAYSSSIMNVIIFLYSPQASVGVYLRKVILLPVRKFSVSSVMLAQYSRKEIFFGIWYFRLAGPIVENLCVFLVPIRFAVGLKAAMIDFPLFSPAHVVQ